MRKEIGVAEWYDKIELEPAELASIEEAKTKIRDRGSDITPSRVIAELTFGFWVRLSASAYEKRLWVPHLHKIFPIKLNRRDLYERLSEIKYLRNRIAHHERIIAKRDLPTAYDSLMEALRWVSPEMEAWVKSTNCFHERWNKRYKVPKPPEQAVGTAAPIPEDQNK